MAAEPAAAESCEAFYRREVLAGQCHCLTASDDVNQSLQRLLLTQARRTTIILGSEQERKGHGGLAVVLRGGAYRGLPSSSFASRIAAQMECSRSIERSVVRPFVSLGVRVHVHLAVYDNVNASLLSELFAPYATHVASISVLAARASHQLMSFANALSGLLEFCSDNSECYDAVLITRFDLRFKANFANLLGDVRLLRGVRYLWRELEQGGGWRFVWQPDEHLLRATCEGNVSASECGHAQARLWHESLRMVRQRNATFLPRSWKASWRTPDTLHFFQFALTPCIRNAVQYEMTRGWKPHGGGTPVIRSSTRVLTNHWFHRSKVRILDKLGSSHC